MGQPKYQRDGDPKTSGPGFGVTLHPATLDEPLRWRKPRMVFTNSMSDLYHEAIPDEYIAQVFAVMAQASQHTFQCLTKRPERMRDLMASEHFQNLVASTRRTPDFDFEWPLPNAWAGVSIENRRFVGRADVLRATPAAVRFVSAEPLLGPLLPDAAYAIDAEHEMYDLGNAPIHSWRPWADGYDGPGLSLEEIDWVIVGGESGPGHRPMQEQWVRDLHNYCSTECWQGEREGQTAFFFKQDSGPKPGKPGRFVDWRALPQDFPEVVA